MSTQFAMPKTRKEVVKLGGDRLRRLELSLGIGEDESTSERNELDYQERVDEVWAMLESVAKITAKKEGEDDFEEDEEDDDEKPKAKRKPKPQVEPEDEDEDEPDLEDAEEGEDEDDINPAKMRGLEVGAKVKAPVGEDKELVKCKVIKISDDGHFVRLRDAEGTTHAGVAVYKVIQLGKKVEKPDGEEVDEEDEDSRKKHTPKPVKPSPLEALAKRIKAADTKDIIRALKALDEDAVGILGKATKPKPQEEDEDEAPVKKKGRKENGNGGVTNTIVRLLTTEASKKHPMTKDELHARLCEEIDDRSPASMLSTVSKIPWTLTTPKMGPNIPKHRVHKQKNEEGQLAYWIDPEEEEDDSDGEDD